MPLHQRHHDFVLHDLTRFETDMPFSGTDMISLVLGLRAFRAGVFDLEDTKIPNFDVTVTSQSVAHGIEHGLYYILYLCNVKTCTRYLLHYILFVLVILLPPVMNSPLPNTIIARFNRFETVLTNHNLSKQRNQIIFHYLPFECRR